VRKNFTKKEDAKKERGQGGRRIQRKKGTQCHIIPPLNWKKREKEEINKKFPVGHLLVKES